MLRLAFFGNESVLTRALCRWLGERTDLRMIVWTDEVPWPHRSGLAWPRVAHRILRGSRRKGVLRALNEAAFYGLYRAFLLRREEQRILMLATSLDATSRRALDQIPQLRPHRVDDAAFIDKLRRLRLDASFVMCTDVRFPTPLLDAARLGTYLWHEGITPEYRGVYSPFWALFNEDYSRIGFTLLRMTDKLDGGPIYIQGPIVDCDFERDWHSYLGHKAILESLPAVDRFLAELGSGSHRAICRQGAQDRYYSYPTASALLRIVWRRLRKSRRGRRLRAPGAVESSSQRRVY